MKKEKIYYKIVNNYPGKGRCSAIETFSKRCVIYKTNGEFTFKPKRFGPLAVFGTIQEAEEYRQFVARITAKSYRIELWTCHIIKPKRKVRSTFARKFFDGTIFADGVRLLEKHNS